MILTYFKPASVFAALTAMLFWSTSANFSCLADEGTEDGDGQASISSSIGQDGTGTIVVEARGQLPKLPVLYAASVDATVKVTQKQANQEVELSVNVIQGDAKTLSFGIQGDGQIKSVEAEGLKSWSVRTIDSTRILDLQLGEDVKSLDAKISIVASTVDFELPTSLNLAHLTPGDAVGFDSKIAISFSKDVEGVVVEAAGFAPLEKASKEDDDSRHFQTSTGGKLSLSLTRSGTSPAPIEFAESSLDGEVASDGKSASFQLRSTAVVSEEGATLTVLSGNIAVEVFPDSADYRLKLTTTNNQPVYQLVFPKAGAFPIEIDFVAGVSLVGAPKKADQRGLNFSIAASAVVPLTLSGLSPDLKFDRGQDAVVLSNEGERWQGFLPASGRVQVRWKVDRQTGDGKLFFTTTGNVETEVGAGLLRQEHTVDYQVLQGELKSVQMLLRGPGEILDVQAENLVGWKVTPKGDDRQLEVTLSRAITADSQFKVRSQTPLEAFPIRVEGMRLDPIGAIRHSGFLRLSNSGSVRLEPTDLRGLTQLAPDQYPGDPIEARQVFAYRFPSSDHAFTVVADRIQPEVSVSELVLYQLAEADRVIVADVELDIREAPIRQWDFSVPADYSVVAVTGANVADYIAASEVTDGRRNLQVLFSADVSGRQLVSFQLEKSEVATAGTWILPRIEYPEAKAVRGNIGVVGEPGFRISVEKSELLVEKPLSYFPKPARGLQQAFRIREPGWSATMRVELLQRSVQADVFHLYSLNQQTVYGSVLVNYFVTGAPVSEWQIAVPAELGNVMVDGQDVRTWRREGDLLIVSLHQPVIGAYTLLVTFEEKPDEKDGLFAAGQIEPIEVQGERGFIQIVSPMLVEIQPKSVSEDLLSLDPLELPAEFRLLSAAPPLGTWQYTERPFDLQLQVTWFQPGTTVGQVVEFSEASSRVSRDGELVTDVLYYVKSRGQRTLELKLPPEPVRLWEVSVAGQVVNARKTEDSTLIPLSGGNDPNRPIEVRLRLGKPAVNASRPDLALPTVMAPVLKAQWNITGDDRHLLIPRGGTVSPPAPVTRPSGFHWLSERGLVPLMLVGLFTAIGVWASRESGVWPALGLVSLIVAMGICIATMGTASSQVGSPIPLQLSLPILSAGETIQLRVANMPLWRIDLSWMGSFLLLAGLTLLTLAFPSWKLRVKTWLPQGDTMRWDTWLERDSLVCGVGLLLVALGVLFQGAGAPWFFGLLALTIFLLLFLRRFLDFIPIGKRSLKRLVAKRKKLVPKKAETSAELESPQDSGGSITATMIFFALSLLPTGTSLLAAEPSGFSTSDSVVQQWQIAHEESRLVGTGTLQITGQPGDRFLLLEAPAVLTKFEGKGLRLSKSKLEGKGGGLVYVASIPVAKRDAAEQATETGNQVAQQWTANFTFRLEAVALGNGIPVLTGAAAVQRIEVNYDEPGWDVVCPQAVRIKAVESGEGSTKASVLLGPGRASIQLAPKARDVTTEETRFFAESFHLYLPGPGVVDGRHKIQVRTAQGQVRRLTVSVPKGLTVSAVRGPIGTWQFDADHGQLELDVEPAQSKSFDIMIETQRGLDRLPAEVILAPLRVAQASSDIGLVAVAFDADAQPEKITATEMSAVNLGDFDATLLPNKTANLHRAYRYGANGGELLVQVIPVEPEIRAWSKQVLSLGDEQVVLGGHFHVEITRTGLFQLSFTLPEGLEVESLTGDALHHWSEVSEGESRKIVLHLNGKTIGAHQFALTLSGAAPTGESEWKIPRFSVNEATRQTGELVVRPTTGIRLSTASRQNVSETDPRSLGGKAQGALAFRLLQKNWDLSLDIEKLEPWITGQVLHEITVREGQTRTKLMSEFQVENASIRSLRISLPLTDANEIKTLRASGETVSDFVRTGPNSSVWEIQFKRRVIGNISFQIEFERRGDRQDETEDLTPATFPDARQLAYYFAVRAGGRLELSHESLTQGWQRADWNSIPPKLRESGNRNSPELAFRSIAPAKPLNIRLQRHALADSLKLRVAKGSLTTVLSATGNQLTAVDVTMEVIQRSSLRVGLPDGGELMSVFVNGESVHSVRLDSQSNDDDSSIWQFYVLPGIDDRTATVRFVYVVAAERLSGLELSSPELNVPLENIEWSVIAPKGFDLSDHDGNLELVQVANQKAYDRKSYLSKISGKRQIQAQQATELLEQASQFLQAGDQLKANRAFSSVANQYALDAASNEDARVQLENIQTQQAVVGLNTRRQRMLLDNKASDTTTDEHQQLRDAAAINPILQKNDLNFRPQQLSELLRGNSTEDNAVLQQIAARLVQHQHTTETAPQAIVISLPEEGSVYKFSRSVQVSEDAPLQLDLDFDRRGQLSIWQIVLTLCVLFVIAIGLGYAARKPFAM